MPILTLQKPVEWLDARAVHGLADEFEDLPGLIGHRVRDQSGRVITTYTGSPRAWMSQFAATPRRLAGINSR
jgi:hypothetical protein